jgi:hypothetical protein
MADALNGMDLLASYLQRVDGPQAPNPVNPTAQAQPTAPSEAPVAPIAIAPAPTAAPVQQQAPPPPPQPNPDAAAVQQLQAAPPANLGVPDVPKKTNLQQVTGPFGSHGLLGSILGHVGDALLVNAGLAPEYQPKIQAAKEADAIADFASNPSAAMTRLAAVAGADKAARFRDDWLLGSQRILQTAKTQADLDQAHQLNPLVVAEAGQKAKAGIYSLAATLPDNADRATIKAVYGKVSGALAGLNLKNDLPDVDNMSDADAAQAMKLWAKQGVDVKDQINEARQAAKDASEVKHNGVMEKIAQQNANSTSANVASEVQYRPVTAGASATSAGAAALNADTNRQLLGPKIANLNASVQNKLDEVAKRKNKNRTGSTPSGAPPVGYKNANGLTFKGGDPNNRANWK